MTHFDCRTDGTSHFGLPPVVIELKKPGVPARAAFDENLTHYIKRSVLATGYSAGLVRRFCGCSGSRAFDPVRVTESFFPSSSLPTILRPLSPGRKFRSAEF